MDIFRSKEVYRKVKKRDGVNTQDPIIPVRGMYVVGQYLVPEYKGSGIEITDIRTTYPRIVNFTESSTTINDTSSTIGLTKFTVSSGITITRYTTEHVKLDKDDSIIGLTKFIVGKLTVNKYTQKKVDGDKQSTVGLTKFIIDGLTVKDYYQIKTNSTPEPLMVIRNVYTKKCIITDVTS